MKATGKNIVRIARFVEQKAWQLRRGGGLVIGLAFIAYAVTVPVTLAWRASHRRPMTIPPATPALQPRP